MWKGLPKESEIETKTRTAGLPKGSDSYGNRVSIVPIAPRLNWKIGGHLLSFPTTRVAQGRDTDYSAINRLNVGFGETQRFFSLSLRSGSNETNFAHALPQETGTRDLTILNKLADLNIRSQKYTDQIIDRNLYSMMQDESIFIIAYNKLKSNPGNMTAGINPTTLDGISKEWILETIESLKTEQFKFTPGRRIQIPKASGGQRPLTIAPPRDKIVQECIRMILEAIFEPTFSENSHGFRAGRSCHSALKHVKVNFDSSTWVIEGDISKCFDTIDHKILMNLVESKIADRRFTNLI